MLSFDFPSDSSTFNRRAVKELATKGVITGLFATADGVCIIHAAKETSVPIQSLPLCTFVSFLRRKFVIVPPPAPDSIDVDDGQGQSNQDPRIFWNGHVFGSTRETTIISEDRLPEGKPRDQIVTLDIDRPRRQKQGLERDGLEHVLQYLLFRLQTTDTVVQSTVTETDSDDELGNADEVVNADEMSNADEMGNANEMSNADEMDERSTKDDMEAPESENSNMDSDYEDSMDEDDESDLRSAPSEAAVESAAEQGRRVRSCYYPLHDLPWDGKRKHHTILYKPMQSMKTDWAVMIMWVESLIFNKVMLYSVRSPGARPSGLPSLMSKGVNKINTKLMDFLNDISDELRLKLMATPAEIHEKIRLECVSDQDMKHVKNAEGKFTYNVALFIKENHRNQQLENFMNDGRCCLLLPMNATAFKFYSDLMTRLHNNNGLSFVPKFGAIFDEHDEIVTDYELNKSKVHEAVYGGEGKGSLNAADMQVPDEEENDADDRDAAEAMEFLFDGTDSLSSLFDALYYPTATPMALIESYHRHPLYLAQMPVAHNYVGLGTPDYCTKTITVVPMDPNGKWNGLQPYRAILSHWNMLDRPRAKPRIALLVNDRTSTVAGQVDLAEEMILFSNESIKTTKPLAVVVNNGNYTRLFFSDHFRVYFDGLQRRIALANVALPAGFAWNDSALQLEISDRLWVNLGNQMAVFDEHRVKYERRHASVIIAVAQAAFSGLQNLPLRLFFLETMQTAQREKTYCSFDRSILLRAMHLHHKDPNRNVANTALQTMGRNCGVDPNNPIPDRFLYCTEAEEAMLLHVIEATERYLELMSLPELRGKRIPEIIWSLKEKRSRDRPARLEEITGDFSEHARRLMLQIINETTTTRTGRKQKMLPGRLNAQFEALNQLRLGHLGERGQSSVQPRRGGGVRNSTPLSRVKRYINQYLSKPNKCTVTAYVVGMLCRHGGHMAREVWDPIIRADIIVAGRSVRRGGRRDLDPVRVLNRVTNSVRDILAPRAGATGILRFVDDEIGEAAMAHYQSASGS